MTLQTEVQEGTGSAGLYGGGGGVTIDRRGSAGFVYQDTYSVYHEICYVCSAVWNSTYTCPSLVCLVSEDVVTTTTAPATTLTKAIPSAVATATSTAADFVAAGAVAPAYTALGGWSVVNDTTLLTDLPDSDFTASAAAVAAGGGTATSHRWQQFLSLSLVVLLNNYLFFYLIKKFEVSELVWVFPLLPQLLVK